MTSKRHALTRARRNVTPLRKSGSGSDWTYDVYHSDLRAWYGAGDWSYPAARTMRASDIAARAMKIYRPDLDWMEILFVAIESQGTAEQRFEQLIKWGSKYVD